MKSQRTFNFKFSLAAAIVALCLAALLFWSSLTPTSAQVVVRRSSPRPPTDTGMPPMPPPDGDGSGAPTPSDGRATLPIERDFSSTNRPAGTNSDQPPTEDMQVSFQGANIDMIVQWLAQTTGKSVVKHPKVQCQITIMGSKKMPPREAVTLVYRALALEGFTVIESGKSILIVPEGQEPKMSPEVLDGSTSGIPVGRQRMMKIFPLQHMPASEMKDRIKAVLSDKAAVDVDDHANQIMVTDYNDNLVLVEDLVKALDSDKPQDVAVRVIPLQHVNAQALVKEVAPLYQKMGAKTPKEMVEVAANDRSNSLLVLSSEANFKAVQAVVAALDTEHAQEKIMKDFVLKNAEAEDAAKQLQQLYESQDNNNRYPYFIFGGSGGQADDSKKISIVPDRRRNALIVQAPPKAMDMLGDMITALDQPISDDSLAPKIYPLKYVSATDIEDILNELFLKKTQQRSYYYWDEVPATPDRDVGRLYGKVRITSEPNSNAIIITANSLENLAAVEEVLKELDVPSQAGDTTFRVGLRFAKAPVLANSINILFAKNGSPPLRPVNQAAQQNNPQNNQQQQNQQQQTSTSEGNFTLEQETKEDNYYPWLGGQPDITRGGGSDSSRSATRPVSDLVGRVRVVADERSNSLLISANVHFFPQVMKLIDELDAPTAQVLIEARIVEVSSDYLDQLGVRWSPNGNQVFTAQDLDNSILASGSANGVKGFGSTANVPFNTSTTPTANGNSIVSELTQMRSGVLSGSINMDFLIQFLHERTQATVLASPQINIEDNETGKIFVGQEVPFIDNSVVQAQGGQNSSFTYKDVGVILEVTPHINSSGDVSLRIHAESSTVVQGETILGGAVIDSRNFKTDLEAKNGQTLVLGGIIQKQITDTLRKTPILGDIPGLGYLFKKKDKTTHEVELMVFLRPKVVRTPEQAKELLDDADKQAPLVKQWQEDNQPAQPGKDKTKSKP